MLTSQFIPVSGIITGKGIRNSGQLKEKLGVKITEDSVYFLSHSSFRQNCTLDNKHSFTSAIKVADNDGSLNTIDDLKSLLKDYYFEDSNREIYQIQVFFSDGGSSSSSIPATETKEEDSTSQDPKTETETETEIANIDVTSILKDSLSNMAGPLGATLAPQVAAGVNNFVNAQIADIVKNHGGGAKEQVIKVVDGDQITELPGMAHLQLEACLLLAKNNHHIYLHGPAGTGKSYLAKQLAEALNRPYYHVQKVADEYQLTGFADANSRYVETELYNAVVNGGVILIDEADASDASALTVINSVTANGYMTFPTKGRVQVADGFLVVMTGNTIGRGANTTYCGRQPLDLATLDRFAFLSCDYDPRIEAMLAGCTPAEIEKLTPARRVRSCKGIGGGDLFKFITALRSAAEESGVEVLVTMRATQALNQLKSIFDIDELLNMFILKGLDKINISTLASKLTGNSIWHDELRKLAA